MIKRFLGVAFVNRSKGWLNLKLILKLNITLEVQLNYVIWGKDLVQSVGLTHFLLIQEAFLNFWKC